ncbi:sensor histidine kinase [Kocuria sp.]|uniref:sensor histidine kinase n=1 Tax=Kocuria sp. TaxID=1871328 RepID=UPI0026DF546C|nr:histidine kinase [Kocuria sp.]MDO5617200.1 histidine kinase [Kocuria sp.]
MKPHVTAAGWVEAHPVATNALVVTALGLLSSAMMAGLGAAGVLGAVLLAAPVYLRIHRPALAAVLVAAAAVVATAVLQTWPVATGLWAVPMVVHRVAARRTRGARLAILGLALFTALFTTLISPRWSAPLFGPGGFGYGSLDWWAALLLLTPLMWLTIVTAYLFGDLKRVKWERQVAQQQRAQALSDRAEALASWAHRLEVERDQEVRLAAQDERTRIAREMHDVVAHSLSVVITQADGARYAAATDPHAATDTLARISTTARDSLTEMRRLLGILRTDEGQLTAPVPGLENLPELVAGVRQAGLPVEFIRPATSDGALAALPPGASLAIYRLVQEALTNTLKHAPEATAAVVQLRSGPDWVEAEIINDGLLADPAPSAPAPLPSSGQGLQGLAERLGVYGGQVQAGPMASNPDRWVLRGWLRTHQPPTATSAPENTTR